MMFEHLQDRLKEVSFKKIVCHNFWLKLISLGVAIIAWFYVYDEVSKMMKGIAL